MIESRRRAYLDAMGLDVWTIKPPPLALDRLILQPGDGKTLLFCRKPEDTAQRFAADVLRALSHDAVWAWPDPEGQNANLTLDQAIGQQLFTRVILFGDELVRRVFTGEPPDVMGSARVLVTLPVEELAVRGHAKQTFWHQLSETGSH